MRRIRLLRITAFIVLAAVLFSALSCSGGSNTGTSTSTTVEVTDIKPSIESVDVINTGTQDKYYAILDITVKNDGTDGMVIITGSVTQGTQPPVTSELPVYLVGKSKQVIRMVLPLKWGAGEPVAKAAVRIP
jgi:hypothetical protein